MVEIDARSICGRDRCGARGAGGLDVWWKSMLDRSVVETAAAHARRTSSRSVEIDARSICGRDAHTAICSRASVYVEMDARSVWIETEPSPPPGLPRGSRCSIVFRSRRPGRCGLDLFRRSGGDLCSIDLRSRPGGHERTAIAYGNRLPPITGTGTGAVSMIPPPPGSFGEAPITQFMRTSIVALRTMCPPTVAA